jgi:hypothetical protein
VLASIDWTAVGAIAAVAGGVVVVGGAVAKTVSDRISRTRIGTRRLDMLEIRLFGLPPDPDTGAKKLDGEFDRIDKRLDELPDQIISALKSDA